MSAAAIPAGAIETYESALAWLTGLSGRGMRLGLSRTQSLLAAMGNPQEGLTGALVAGTNGKGSVCAFTESILRAAGLRTALMVKPHLESYRERICLNADPVSRETFARALARVAAAAATLEEGPSEFEALTAAGVWVAASEHVDSLVCEVGLGGRLDSTNVLDLGSVAVTEIGLDHMQQLGSTIPEIAGEKAAVIKAGNAVVASCSGDALEVVRARCAEVGAHLLDPAFEITLERAGLHGSLAEVRPTAAGGPRLSLVRLPLAGRYQAANAAAAATLAREVLRRRGLNLGSEVLRQGLEAATWPARLELFPGSPDVVLDGAHNPAALRACLAEIAALAPGRAVHAVFAVMSDKDLPAMVSALRTADLASLWLTGVPGESRAADPGELARLAPGLGQVIPDPHAALESARAAAGAEGLVLICGSLYLAGLLRSVVAGIARLP